jgi:hypothetical protein
MTKSLLKREEMLCIDSRYDFNGPIDSVISRLQEKKAKYRKQGYTKIRIEFEDAWGYCDDHRIDVVYYGSKIVKEK